MDSKDLIDIMTRFLRKDFKRGDAESFFGTVASDRIPETITLRPKADYIEWVILNSVKIKGDYFLSGMYLKLKSPISIDFQVLTKTYGTPFEGVRLHPDEPRPYVFEVKGGDYRGELMVGILDGTQNSYEAGEIQFSRTPPGW